MAPESSLPHSHQSTTYSYPEPDQLSSSPPFNFLKVHFNITSHLYTGLLIGLLHLGFTTSILYISCFLPHTCYMPRPSHFSWFDPSNNVCWGALIMKLSCHLLQSPLTSSLLGPHVCLSLSLSAPFSNILRPRSSLSKRHQVSHSYKTTGKITVLHILIVICFLAVNWKIEDPGPSGRRHSPTSSCF
jgi:hypothetical protein